jgi:hypothetical protein
MRYTNRLLDDEARKFYKSTENKLIKACPEIMGRKISRANVQQAFTLATVLDYEKTTRTANGGTRCSMLCVGNFEDPSWQYLYDNHFLVEGIDPQVKNSCDLHTFTKSYSKYDIVFSTSVIEHVQNDEEFIHDVCSMLHKGGIAILTCDFNKYYKQGGPVPATVIRQYTENDFINRFNPILENNNCTLLSEYDWSGEPEFEYQGHMYNFATYVFIKRSNNGL